VQLSGFVKVPDIVSRAGRVTAGVNGVRTVHNNIAVR
jgi:osmotically-inducible protein OsmY